jgi:hypothetical protein
MAASPSHRFGQIIGDILELVLERDLELVCSTRNLYLDMVGKTRPARRGKKVSWNDSYGNKHDLDFVIEKNGTDTEVGDPVAFIESAWRRYTKHSKNKAQEIQAAVLPVAEAYSEHKPFLGVLLSGEFTGPSLQQLSSVGFKVLYIPYPVITEAFQEVGIDAFYDERTPTAEFANKVSAFDALTAHQKNLIVNKILTLSSEIITTFTNSLIMSVDRRIDSITLISLFGDAVDFRNIASAVQAINSFDLNNMALGSTFKKFEIIVHYTNGDSINGQFSSKERALSFLNIID